MDTQTSISLQHLPIRTKLNVWSSRLIHSTNQLDRMVKGRGGKRGGNRGGGYNNYHNHHNNHKNQNNNNNNQHNNKRNNKDGKKGHQNDKAQKKFVEALLAAGLGQKNESDLQVHKRLVLEAVGLVQLYKLTYPVRVGHLRNLQVESPLWGVAAEVMGFSNDFCSFVHPVGILDSDGDSAMGGGSFCTCLGDDWNIPDCFLRGFFYLLLVCRERVNRGGE